MTAKELREKFLDFMKSKGHTIIPSASLVPENDPSILFTTAGMHPLVPYLLGEKHPGGKRVANVQKCIRTGDIDEVGDNRHLTFFEMMGNWSFGDYFKKEAIVWSWEFLTDEKWLRLDKNRIYITVFKGENNIPRDEESIEIWKETFEKEGIKVEVAGEDEIIKDNVRIIPLGTEDNFWIAGETGPCGGDTEMFYDTRPDEGKLEGKFQDLVDTGRIIEVWNDVFMEFNKTTEVKYEKLEKPNVDTGMGVERTLAVLNSKETPFETELFEPIFTKLSKISGKKYEDNEKAFRIIADHVKASVFIISDGVTPLNVGRGYVVRRLVRRAVRYGKQLGIEKNFLLHLASAVVKVYNDFYPELKEKEKFILKELNKEEDKFNKKLERSEKIIKKSLSPSASPSPSPEPLTDEEIADRLFIYRTQEGIPIETSKEIVETSGTPVTATAINMYDQKIKKHQDLSRTASAGMFKGGLADSSEETKKLHTAAHLLLAALRKVLGDHVVQKGSNINSERLRFDFSHPEKLTPEQIKEAEDLVNDAISKNIPVICNEMSLDEAKKQGAMGVFESKYGDKVKVYKIGEVSNEICGGPHVEQTGILGKFKITKEESSSAGVRRIKAVLE